MDDLMKYFLLPFLVKNQNNIKRKLILGRITNLRGVKFINIRIAF